MSHRSRTFQLVEKLLDEPLVDYARGRRENGGSWHSISVALSTRTGITVTPETLRIWLGQEHGMGRRSTERAS